MSEMTIEEQTKQAIQFLASEMRELKKKVEMHTHHIEQIRRAVVSLNELMKKNEEIAELVGDIDDLKMRLNEIQAKEHRKFVGGGENRVDGDLPSSPQSG